MNVKLSSKGQLVIPKKIRHALDLQPGTEFDIKMVGKQIILQPIVDKAEMLRTIEKLHTLAKGSDLLDMLEEEHRWEREKEHRREQSLFAG
ncbi:MAG: AbrB/MazE/SpoVT family DNA-binding domain-containing protein [Chloroflexi bacterium]|nr:AbrB/MazE/SpoVT family DNA-binding domain-containing protein [Chloroflexota bacterium]